MMLIITIIRWLLKNKMWGDIILIIGNIIALAASILMVYTGIIKSKQKIIYVQSIQIGLYIVSNLVLNGISGAIINAISFVRNILCYKNKLGFIWKIIISFLAVFLIIYFNNLGFVGYLPLISTLAYLWLMTLEDVIKFKSLIIFTLILWAIYDFSIKSYTSCFFDILTIITNIISIIKCKGDSK